MGLLYEGWDRTLRRRVAVKVLMGGLEPSAQLRAVHEAQAAARVRSDHIVQIFDASPQDHIGLPYLVMELLEGEDLQAVMRRGPVRTKQAVDWILQACEAVAHLALHGIVHRDIKPANLFLEQRIEGGVRLKLLDFGVAKHPITPGNSALTSAGQVIGSLPYLAPEQLSDSRDVDVRTDVWGLGVVLYELLGGQSPFHTPQLSDSIARIKSYPHKQLSFGSCRIPSALSAVVDRCLEKSKQNRWQDIAQLARALAPFASHHGAAIALRVQKISSLQPVRCSQPPTRGPAPIELASLVNAPGPDLQSLHYADDDLQGQRDSSFISVSTAATTRGSKVPKNIPFHRSLVRIGIMGPACAAIALVLFVAWFRAEPSITYQHKYSLSPQLDCHADYAMYEAMALTRSIGSARGRDWNLFTNGSVSQQHPFEHGQAELIITAGADFAGQELPHMIVSVDNRVIGEVDIQSRNFHPYSFTYQAVAGLGLVRVEFSNDFLEDGKDRNLLVRGLEIGQCATP